MENIININKYSNEKEKYLIKKKLYYILLWFLC